MTPSATPIRPARTPRPAPATRSPDAALRNWPETIPLAMLRALPDPGDPRARPRWTILARPARIARPDSIEALARHIESPPAAARAHPLANPLAGPHADPPPWTGGWIGWLGYDLGAVIEPAATSPEPAHDDRGWPIAELARCDAAYAFDHATGAWWLIGDPARLPEPDALTGPPEPAEPCDATDQPFELSPMASATGRARFIDAVARCVEYIHAGDAFQINLTHRLSGAMTGSTRALMGRLLAAAEPWYGGMIELPAGHADRRTILSVSPELFLTLDPDSRRITTRPMKGTRPGDADPAELMASRKDRAELDMIIDLMRNDLGRVAEFGSVRVDEPRAIERHATRDATILQAAATISARLRGGLALPDLLAATFPGGSITGAPKVRAMQIIDQLEPVRRGPYCGSLGCISDNGFAAFNIAIRTASVTGAGPPDRPGRVERGTLDYSVGAGIVADSDPEAEWRETLDKAGPLRAITHLTDAP